MIIWLLTALTVVMSAHAVMFAAATSWYTKQAGLWRSDHAKAQWRALNRPWWVRYFEWLERRASSAREKAHR